MGCIPKSSLPCSHTQQSMLHQVLDWALGLPANHRSLYPSAAFIHSFNSFTHSCIHSFVHGTCVFLQSQMHAALSSFLYEVLYTFASQLHAWQALISANSQSVDSCAGDKLKVTQSAVHDSPLPSCLHRAARLGRRHTKAQYPPFALATSSNSWRSKAD